MTLVPCPICNEEIAGNATVCPKCGGTFGRVNCMHCNTLIFGHLKKCPNCGGTFTKEDRAKKDQEAGFGCLIICAVVVGFGFVVWLLF